MRGGREGRRKRGKERRRGEGEKGGRREGRKGGEGRERREEGEREGKEERGGRGGEERMKRKKESSVARILFGSLTKLMWNFMKQYSNGGTQPQRKALGDGCPNSQPVCQLVDAVTEDDEPGQWLDVTEEKVDTPETTFLLTILVEVSFFLFLLLCIVLSMLLAVPCRN